MTGTPLTSDELAWIAANTDAVRALMAGSAATPSEPELASDDPLTETTTHLINWMQNVIGGIETELERNRKPLAQYLSTIANANIDDESRVYAKELLEEDGPEYEAKIAVCEKHIEAIQRKIEILKSNPAELLLPIGTIVKFVGVPDYENSRSLSDDRKSYPVAGTIGVVTRLNRKDEYPLGVSVRDQYEDGWGQRFEGDYDRFQTFRADIGMFEVVGHGLLPNGEEYRGYGFHQTHIGSLDRHGDNRQEMVLEANGHFWRFHDFGGIQSVEALQAFDSMDEMSWIEGLSEEYQSTALPRATSPSP